MATIIFTKSCIIKGLIVVANIFLSTLWISENPFLKCFLNKILLFSSKHRLILINFIMIFTITIINSILYRNCTKIKGCLKNRISIHAACTISLSGCHRMLIH